MIQSTNQRRGRLASLISAQSPVATTQLADEGSAVKDLHLYPLREPISGRRYTVVKVRSRAGLTGFGECGTVSAGDLAKAKQIVLGQAATAYEAVRRQLEDMPNLQAAVNMALLDLLGKAVRAPLYQVLGGPTRNRVRALTALEGASDEALLSSMRRAQQAGYRAFLVPVPPATGLSQRRTFIEAVRRRLDGLRAAGGSQLDFVLSGAGGLSAGEASSLAGALEAFHLLWFDEPCRLSNIGAVRKIGAESVTPLGFGRHLYRPADFQDLLREEVADLLRPSLSLNGIGQIRKIAALAETYYVAVAPYHDGGPVGTAAALHLAASLPNFFIQQVPLSEAEADRQMRAEITGDSVEIVKDGFLGLPVAPGLGITVQEIALEKYQEASA